LRFTYTFFGDRQTNGQTAPTHEAAFAIASSGLIKRTRN